MVPAEQRLHAGDAVVGQIHERLIVEFETVLRERLAQFAFEAEPLAHGLVHLRLEQADGAAPLGLRLVEGEVGLLEEALDILRDIARGQGDADAHPDLDDDPVEGVGRGDHLDQALGQCRGPGRILDAGEHGELVAPEPRHHVVAAHMAPQPLGHRPQQVIADRVAEAVVDRLEPVEVEAEHGERRLGVGAQRLDPLGADLAQAGAVGQVGEAVVAGHVDDARLVAPPLGDVLEGRHPAAALGHGPVGHGDDPPVGEFAQHRFRPVSGQRRAGAFADRVDRDAALVAPDRHQRLDDGALAHADMDGVLGEAEDLQVAPVPHQEPLPRIEHAQALAHVLQGGVEAPVLLAELGMGLDQGDPGPVLLADVAADAPVAQELALGREDRATADLEPARRAVGMAVDVGQLAERAARGDRLAIGGEARPLLLADQGRPRGPDQALRAAAQQALGPGGDGAESILGIGGPEPIEGDSRQLFDVIQRHGITVGGPDL
ncbi:hypothetical protein CHKEEEPN_4457 [Methylorubrum podarium]|nr:hypothetical protein CHKEEEPN_4457 [Methylorubrum podarium]